MYTHDNSDDKSEILMVTPYGLVVQNFPGQIYGIGDGYFTLTSGWGYQFNILE